MNKRDRDRYRRKLTERKKEIVDAISEFYNESKKIEETGLVKDVGDKAETAYTKEFLLSLSNTERKQLMLIDEALKRIDKSDYDICQMCNKIIGKKRLDAVPWASYCIECQEKAEEESS